MKIEVIAIGNELLAGSTINGNAAFISSQLRDAGYQVHSHRVVADAEEALKQALEEALSEFDLVLCTGGLGPTLDDRTRQYIASVFNTELEHNDEVAKRLIKRYGAKVPSLENQVVIPKAATPFHNTVGTAPGLLLEKHGHKAVFMPGVPVEMQEMFSSQVIPYIQEHYPLDQRQFRDSVQICLVKEADVDEVLRPLADNYPDIEFGIYPFLGRVTVTVTTLSDDQATAEKRLHQPIDDLRQAFANKLYQVEGDSLQHLIQHYFIENGLTLATAESCTGGEIAAGLTKIPGASNYFLGSVVSYSNQAKQALLGVQEETLQKHGAVSEETAKEMAEGALKAMNSDYAIATTGIAGPGGGSEEKPVGTVWMAIAKRSGDTEARKLRCPGNREAVIRRTVHYCLGHLWLSL